MLARSFRLKKREIDRVYKKGQKIPKGFLLVRYVLNSAKHSRFAVIIPKKVAAKSVSRSRLKRLAHETLYKEMKSLKSNYDVIISFQKFPDEKEIEAVLKDVLQSIR